MSLTRPREIGRNCRVTLRYRSGTNWVYHPDGTNRGAVADGTNQVISGIARSIRLTDSGPPIDATAIGDLRRVVEPGTVGTTLVIEKLVIKDLYFVAQVSGSDVFLTGSKVNGTIRFTGTGQTYDFTGVVSSIDVEIGVNQVTIERCTIECDTYV